MKPDQEFWVGQKAFINKNDEVLILHSSASGKLDFPGGKIQEGENDFIESLKREVREEVGLEIEVGVPFAVWQFIIPSNHPDETKRNKKVFLVAYRCELVSGEVFLSDEHKKYKWVNKSNFQEEDDGSQYYRALEKYFK